MFQQKLEPQTLLFQYVFGNQLPRRVRFQFMIISLPMYDDQSMYDYPIDDDY